MNSPFSSSRDTIWTCERDVASWKFGVAPRSLAYSVIVLFEEASQGKSKSFIGSYAPVHAVYRPGSGVLIDFLAFSRRHVVLLLFYL